MLLSNITFLQRAAMLALFKYGHSTDVGDVQADFKVQQFLQVIRFLHSDRALQERRCGKHKMRGNYGRVQLASD